MAVKSVNKSVRLTEEVFALVDQRPEVGFNNKFEGMVLEFYRSHEERLCEAARLERYISDKQQQLQDLIRRCNKVQYVQEKISDIACRVKDLEGLLE